MQRFDGLDAQLAGLSLGGVHQAAAAPPKFALAGHHNEWQPAHQHNLMSLPHGAGHTGLPPEFAHLAAAAAAAPHAYRGAPGLPVNGFVPAAPLPPHSMGWGGQAIPENGSFKAPWFGKSRGRGGPAGGRGRGRGAAPGCNGSSGRRGGRRYDGNGLGGGGDELSIDSLVALVGATPASQPIGDAVYQALFQLDGRACALLLKDLSKAGLQFRCGRGDRDGARVHGRSRTRGRRHACMRRVWPRSNAAVPRARRAPLPPPFRHPRVQHSPF